MTVLLLPQINQSLPLSCATYSRVTGQCSHAIKEKIKPNT